MTWGPILRKRREWDERFLKALARLEDERQKQAKCAGCGRAFGDHPVEDYEECVREVLNTV